MNRPAVSSWLICTTGLVLGIAGDILLRESEAPGLNMFVFITLCAAAAVLLTRRAGRELDDEAGLLLATGVVFAAALAWRDAPLLKLTSFAVVGVTFSLPAFRAGRAWVRRAGIGEYVVALVSAGAHAVLGAIAALLSLDWDQLRSQSRGSPAGRRVLAGVRGVALALPLLVVFGGLLITADDVFARMVTNTLRIDLETIASHVLLIGFLTWITTGALIGFLRGTASAPLMQEVDLRGGRIGAAEITVALGLLGLLFAVFVGVQFRYLFGGTALVEVTPGLTYAEYARRGFFELVAVVALALPLLLISDWLLRRDSSRDERTFRIVAGAHILLLLAIAASGLQRMRAYVDAYGLTELRFHVTAVLLLICVVLLWFGATVLRDRRQSFAFGSLLAAIATAAILIVVNPDAVIARTNIERAQSRTTDTPFDVVYATSLSADAVPVLIDRLPALEGEEQCRVAQRLLRRWGPDAERSLRSWSLSDARARRLVRENARELGSAAGQGC